MRAKGWLQLTNHVCSHFFLLSKQTDFVSVVDHKALLAYLKKIFIPLSSVAEFVYLSGNLELSNKKPSKLSVNGLSYLGTPHYVIFCRFFCMNFLKKCSEML